MTTTDPAAQPRCILTVHAHPDDESSKGPGTIARYAAEGVRTVLVTCTGGEAGDILNPAADSEEARTNLAAVRRRELEEAVGIIGYHRLVWLGYRDSGMPGTPTNEHPGCFHRADLDEAVVRLVRVAREERPQVMVAYGPSDAGRGHPDHIRTHEIGLAAFERAGDPAWYPEAGAPWQPSKLYYVGVFSRPRLQAMHEWLTAQELESPWGERLVAMADLPDRTTTRIDITDHLDVGRRALLAHRTQIDPSGHWFRVPLEVLAELHPYEDYELAASRVSTAWPEGGFEDDLFAGIGR
ncbi:MAG: mycothiol conjugate amidase Mca [Acidimicrobiia bacterium]